MSWSNSQYRTWSRKLFAVAGWDGSRVFPKSQTTLLGGFEFLRSCDSSKQHCPLLQREHSSVLLRVGLGAEHSDDLAAVFRYFPGVDLVPVTGGQAIND